jgi:dienelactone hydrolase
MSFRRSFRFSATSVFLSVAGAMLLSGCNTTGNNPLADQYQNHVAFSKSEMFQMTDRKFGQQSVPTQIYLPKNGKAPYPLIIHQHGSGRDGFQFEGGIGHTDEHGTRLRRAALENGYAFAVLDAFEGKGLSPSDKGKFPNADRYVSQFRAQLLEKYSSLDGSNIFLTGFSYGADDAAMGQLYPPKRNEWKAIVAAEPGCNVSAEPSTANRYPLLILKGTKSHYYPIACELVVERHKQVGNPVDISLLDGGNHYFSLNGKISYNGIAFNGCSKNPIFIDRWMLRHHDGTEIQREDLKKCFTREGGGGKGRELLDDAIEKTIQFFEKHRTSNK